MLPLLKKVPPPEKRKIKFPFFYAFYVFFMISALVVIFFALAALSAYLYDYENSLPKYVAQDIFDTYFSPIDFGLVFDKAECEISPLEDKNDFIHYMNEKTNGQDITYFEVSAGLGDTKKYVVSADKKKIAEFSLKKSGETNKHNFDLYELDTLSVLYTADEKVAIKAVKGGTVFINGQPLSLEYASPDEIKTESFEHLPPDVSGIAYQTFALDGLLLPPTISTTDRYGDESILLYNEAENIYVEQINYDTQLKEEMSEYVIKACETYAKFMTRDTYLASLAVFFDKTSKIYEQVRTSEVYWYTPHIGYEFKDTDTDEFYAYNDEIFSCRYRSTMNVFRTANETHPYTMDLTLYFKKINGVYLIFDFVTNIDI